MRTILLLLVLFITTVDLAIRSSFTFLRVTRCSFLSDSYIGDEAEWERDLIPNELTPGYVLLGGREWPLSAASTFGIAIRLTQKERQKLRGGLERNLASGVALAAGQLDDDVDEHHKPDAGAGEGAELEVIFANENSVPAEPPGELF